MPVSPTRALSRSAHIPVGAAGSSAMLGSVGEATICWPFDSLHPDALSCQKRFYGGKCPLVFTSREATVLSSRDCNHFLSYASTFQRLMKANRLGVRNCRVRISVDRNDRGP